VSDKEAGRDAGFFVVIVSVQESLAICERTRYNAPSLMFCRGVKMAIKNPIRHVGEKVMVDCSPDSPVYAHIKTLLSGRIGEVVATWSPEDGSSLNHRNCTVSFPATKRAKEREIEMNFNHLLSAPQDTEHSASAILVASESGDRSPSLSS